MLDVLQVAKFYACEYYPAGNVIGYFPCVPLSPPFRCARALLTRLASNRKNVQV